MIESIKIISNFAAEFFESLEITFFILLYSCLGK